MSNYAYGVKRYFGELFSLGSEPTAFLLVVLILITGSLYALTSWQKRHAVDNGIPYTPRRIMLVFGPLAYLLLAALMLTGITSPRSLIFGAIVFSASLLVADTTARNSALRAGFTRGGGLTAITRGHLPRALVFALLWLLGVMVGFATLVSVGIAFAVCEVATRRYMASWHQQNATFERTKRVLAAVLQVPESAINPGDFTGDLSTGVDVTNVPPAAARRRDALDAQLALIYPGLSVGQLDHDHITLVPIDAEAAERRRIEQDSGGLISGVGTAGVQDQDYSATPAADADAGSDW